MRILVALGGNALLRRGEKPSAEAQRANIRDAAQALAGIIAAHTVVVTHGNGPQVGFLALQTASCGPLMPLDVLDAESEGMIGYVIEQELAAVLPSTKFATLLTQTVVDPEDPAFANPTKPIGPMYEKAVATELAAKSGWSIGADGSGYRRLVASPAPLQILEREPISILLAQGVTVICAGGGGVPVARQADGRYTGVEAVVDKDRASGLLADALGMDALLILTDVDGVYENWGRPDQRLLSRATPAQLMERGFASGSMGPKVEAACAFASSDGRFAAIGNLRDAEAMLEGRAGTRIANAPEAARVSDEARP